MFVYKFVRNNRPEEAVFGSFEEARKAAVKDVESGDVYPREIVNVVMDRDAIVSAWEEDLAFA